MPGKYLYWQLHKQGRQLGKFHSVKNAAATSEAFAVVSGNEQLASWGAFVSETGPTRFTHVVATFNAFAGLTTDGTVETWGTLWEWCEM